MQNEVVRSDTNSQDSESPHFKPFRITWHGKTYAVKNIANYHTVTENGNQLHVFTAADGADSFELKFTSADMAWFLGE